MLAVCAVMQTGPGKGGKGEVAGSPNRMEQGFVMPATCGAYDESLYRSAQQAMPVPPSTPSNSSRNQGRVSNSTPEQENASGQGMPGMPPFAGGKGACNMQGGSGFGSYGAQQGNVFQGPPGFFQSQRPQMFANGPSFPVNQVFGPQSGGCVSQVMPGMPLFQGNVQQGPVLGGLTPQAQQMQNLLTMSQGLSSSQLLTLMQGLQEQMRSQARLNPEQFGEVPSFPEVPGAAVPNLAFSRDGDHNNVGQSQEGSSLDAFSKSEKWLGVPPKPNFDGWNTREGEVIGWSQYLIDLSSWAAQASIEFSTEIQQSARWHSSISLDGLSPARRARAMRLNAILKSSLQDHARTSNLINAFGEGVSLDESCEGLNMSQLGNGFELLRQLTMEYSLRTRAEALAIRSQFASRSFVLSPKETSPTSVVSDVIRRLDLESARFNKLLSTLGAVTK